MERKSSDGGQSVNWSASYSACSWLISRSIMLLVWHTIGQKSRGCGHSLYWHVVRMNYSVTDFMMLNTVNLCGFVTLTLWHFVTPQQVRHWLLINSKCNLFKFNSLCHRVSLSNIRSMAQRRTDCNRWWTVCLLAFNRKTDVLILIRIRIDITNCSRSLRSLPTQSVERSITQRGTVYKEASEASGNQYLLYPHGGIDQYSL